MADLLLKGIKFMASMRTKAYSQTVSINFGFVTVPNVPARIGRSQDIRQDTSSGVVLVEEVRDFIIKAVDYDYGAGPVEPVAGHIIVDSSSGSPVEYVVRPTTSETESRWADRYGQSWRIHTKRKLIV